MTNHFTLKCPWKPDIGPPSSAEVLIKATFHDYQTGRRYSAAELVKLALPLHAAANPSE